MIKNLSIIIYIYFTLICSNTSLFSQNNDSLSLFSQSHKKKYLNVSNWSDPKKASVLSAILPGAGQIYNKKYWKVPVVYALGGLLVYNTIQQNNHYQYFKKELLNVLNGGISKEGYSSDQLILLKNQSKKWRDLSIAGVVLVYLLNIIDANVDAHLKTFDVSDNLSLKITPNLSPDISIHSHQSSYLGGVSIRVNLK